MFSAKFKYLHNEAYLTYGGLSVGLTSLRNAAHPDKPTFYMGFFNTAVALERMMKLIVIVDYMLQNNFAVPNRAQLRAFGHDLVSLHAACVSVANRHGVADVTTPASGSIEAEVLKFFSDFATHARYYNLDALSGSSPSYEDPLSRWEQLLTRILGEDVPEKRLNTIRARASGISRAIEDVTMVLQHGMQGQLLTLEEALAAPSVHDLAAQYAMVHLFNLLAPLIELTSDLGRKGFYGSPRNGQTHVPEFSDFFVLFGGTPAEIRRKKRWP